MRRAKIGPLPGGRWMMVPRGRAAICVPRPRFQQAFPHPYTSRSIVRTRTPHVHGKPGGSRTRYTTSRSPRDIFTTALCRIAPVWCSKTNDRSRTVNCSDVPGPPQCQPPATDKATRAIPPRRTLLTTTPDSTSVTVARSHSAPTAYLRAAAPRGCAPHPGSREYAGGRSGTCA